MCHTGGLYGKNPGSQTERGMVTDMKSAERTEHVYREVTLAQISEQDIGRERKVAGWVENIRDHGGVSFLDLRQSYDYLKATFDILRDTNTSLLDTIKEISTAYEAADACHFYHWYEETKQFDRLLSNLPQRAWIE